MNQNRVTATNDSLRIMQEHINGYTTEGSRKHR